MKYMLMILGRQSDYDAMSGTKSADGPVWTEADLKTMFEFMGAVNNDLAESGELIDGQGLAEPSQARLVNGTRDGQPVVSDGPYGETKEVLAGYWVLECESIDRATEIAARVGDCPVPEGAARYPVVVHPIADGPPADV
ncbi:YciI family protein [Streptomyces sp. N2-109]|uniref:YciI family protein n=1 Tax=Streptomyces gossypii TaxID=2883101 RepID=A0ABT2K215_9ACTN|nr:YciI family protein [Streptomyces gossypii]MCT2594136.1 YciI family protein [Streptomyces gossypii]